MSPVIAMIAINSQLKIGDVVIGKSGAPYGVAYKHYLCVVNDLLLYRGDWQFNDISVLCIGFDTYGCTDEVNSMFYVDAYKNRERIF